MRSTWTIEVKDCNFLLNPTLTWSSCLFHILLIHLIHLKHSCHADFASVGKVLCFRRILDFIILPTAYVVRREGNVLTRVCPSFCLSTPGGRYPGQIEAGGVPQPGPARGDTPAGGYPCRGYPTLYRITDGVHDTPRSVCLLRSCVHAGGLSCVLL